MKGWQVKEMNKAAETPHITVHKSSLEFEIKTQNLKCWELIVGFPDGRLEWMYTYSPQLAELGSHTVEFYKDKSYRKCIRIPRKDS